MRYLHRPETYTLSRDSDRGGANKRDEHARVLSADYTFTNQVRIRTSCTFRFSYPLLSLALLYFTDSPILRVLSEGERTS